MFFHWKLFTRWALSFGIGSCYVNEAFSTEGGEDFPFESIFAMIFRFSVRLSLLLKPWASLRGLLSSETTLCVISHQTVCSEQTTHAIVMYLADTQM